MLQYFNPQFSLLKSIIFPYFPNISIIFSTFSQPRRAPQGRAGGAPGVCPGTGGGSHGGVLRRLQQRRGEGEALGLGAAAAAGAAGGGQNVGNLGMINPIFIDH